MKRLFIFLLPALAVLTACMQPSEEPIRFSESSDPPASSASAASVTKSFQLDKEIDGLNQTMLMTITYKGQEYEKVVLHFSQALDEESKQHFAGQELEELKAALLPSIEQATGIDKLAEVRGVTVTSDLTEQGTVEIDLVIDPSVLDYEAAIKVPDYSDIFSTMQSSTPEQFIRSFKSDGAKEVVKP